MIEADGYQFQNLPTDNYLWVETLLFPIVVPEAHIYALVYTNVRPSLGVMWNQIMICGALTETRAELLHYAENHHLPAPADFLDIRSPLGLEISARKPPREFRIDYSSADGTEIHVDWVGLMEPFDIHDPAHSPQAGRVADIHSDRGAGERKRVGHVDMTGRVTGTLRVRGRDFTVDSVERMDRSWGVRDPMKAGKANHIVSATFGTDLAFHMICPWNPEAGPESFTLAHGYVMEDGVAYGLTENMSMRSQGDGLVCSSLDMVVEDVRGRTYELWARPDIGAPWIAAPTAVVHNALMEWRFEHRQGYGVVMRTFFLPDLIARHGRFHDDPPGRVWA